MAGPIIRAMKPFRIQFSPALLALTGGVLLVWLTALGSTALAHNVVEDRVPVPESTITTSPVDVSIVTDNPFLDVGDNRGGFAIAMMDEDGLYYGDGCVELLERQMTASVALGGPGTYSVVYQFVSVDGHSVSENYTVEFQPGADHTPSTGKPDAPVCGAELVAPEEVVDAKPLGGDVVTDATPQETTPAAANQTWVLVGGLVLVGAAGTLWWVRSRKKASN